MKWKGEVLTLLSASLLPAKAQLSEHIWTLAQKDGSIWSLEGRVVPPRAPVNNVLPERGFSLSTRISLPPTAQDWRRDPKRPPATKNLEKSPKIITNHRLLLAMI